LTAHRSAYFESTISCPDCFKGSERTDATPTDKVTTLHGLPTCIAEPSEGRSPKGIVVIVPDAFGWEFVDNRLLVDEYARTGYFTVYLPDFMDGKLWTALKAWYYPSTLMEYFVISFSGLVVCAWNAV